MFYLPKQHVHRVVIGPTLDRCVLCGTPCPLWADPWLMTVIVRQVHPETSCTWMIKDVIDVMACGEECANSAESFTTPTLQCQLDAPNDHTWSRVSIEIADTLENY